MRVAIDDLCQHLLLLRCLASCLVQFGRLPKSFAPQLSGTRFRFRDTLEFAGSLGTAAGLHVSDCKLLCYIGRELAARPVAAECLQNRRCPVPRLKVYQRRCSVIFGSLTYGRMRYRLAQPGEMDDRRFQVATVAGKLTLFIDGRCDPVVYLLPGLLVARRSKRLQLVIRGFRLGKAIQVELRMGNDGPCRARKAVL